MVVATLFCVLFGQGTHLHDLDIHISGHLDIHAHLHAHESHDQPMQTNHNQEGKKHQHKVSTASDIIGTLAPSIQVKSDMNVEPVISSVAAGKLINQKFEEIPTLFDLPPPSPVSNQYHLSSFSRRGPPIA